MGLRIEANETELSQDWMSLIVPVRKELEERAACISVMHREKSNLYFLPPKKGADAFLSRLSCQASALHVFPPLAINLSLLINIWTIVPESNNS